MTKKEALKEILEGRPILLEGIDLNGEADDKFIEEIKIIKKMIERIESK